MILPVSCVISFDASCAYAACGPERRCTPQSRRSQRRCAARGQCVLSGPPRALPRRGAKKKPFASAKALKKKELSNPLRFLLRLRRAVLHHPSLGRCFSFFSLRLRRLLLPRRLLLHLCLLLHHLPRHLLLPPPLTRIDPPPLLPRERDGSRSVRERFLKTNKKSRISQ